MTDATPSTLASKIVGMICRQAIENPKCASDAMALLETIAAGTIDFLIKPGCDDVVLDAFFESVKSRLAVLRTAELKHAHHRGTA